MKYVILVILFIIQAIAFFLVIPMSLVITLSIPYKENLSLTCLAFFVIGVLAFIANQLLLYLWDKDK